ncbi:MAG: hypothetical protein LBG87_03125 [Spirochaetaceae bacterium]|nr:hypothetical protein [Spirochaetaceae bacterium]
MKRIVIETQGTIGVGKVILFFGFKIDRSWVRILFYFYLPAGFIVIKYSLFISASAGGSYMLMCSTY